MHGISRNAPPGASAAGWSPGSDDGRPERENMKMERKYKVDLTVGYTNGKYVRDNVYTFERKTEREAIAFARGLMMLHHNMMDADMFFVHSVKPI